VSLVLPRGVDFATTCGRSAAELLYDVGFEPDGRINAIDMKVGCWAIRTGWLEPHHE
jgi:xanthine dehydrogenase molybdopterin-binding subunit B